MKRKALRQRREEREIKRRELEENRSYNLRLRRQERDVDVYMLKLMAFATFLAIGLAALYPQHSTTYSEKLRTSYGQIRQENSGSKLEKTNY